MLTIPGGFTAPAFEDGHSYDVDLAHAGQGNWRAFRAIGLPLDEVQEIARGWAREFAGIARPWLCWNVDEDWCGVQQRMAASVGWTPVVGYDPRVGPPRDLAPSAVLVDFNRELGLPVLYPHFPLEFAHLFSARLAFWHSDLLVRPAKLRRAAALFEQLSDGEIAVTSGWAGWRRAFGDDKKRYFELIGCTTAAASADQFGKGCGWWMDYWAHPNQPAPRAIRSRYYWDHGAGVWYWRHRAGGRCTVLSERIFREGHFTKVRKRSFRRYREAASLSDARRLMAGELNQNFDLAQACRALGLDQHLRAQSHGPHVESGAAMIIR